MPTVVAATRSDDKKKPRPVQLSSPHSHRPETAGQRLGPWERGEEGERPFSVMAGGEEYGRPATGPTTSTLPQIALSGEAKEASLGFFARLLKK